MKTKIEMLKQAAKDKNIILVDCFDTLIYRICSPECVIQRWIGNIAHKYGINFNHILKSWNATIEKQRINNSIIGVDEKTFNDLCRELWIRLKISTSLLVSFEDFFSTILAMMISVEEAVTCVDLQLREFVIKSYEDGKKVYCVSDFYLPKIAIERILEKEHINMYISEIFVSSDVGKRKSTGRLYQYVLEQIGCDAQDAIMIGDNVYSDIRMASLIGISTFCYQNGQKKNTNYFQDVFVKELARYNEKNSMPYANYGFSLYLFNIKLYESLCRLGYEKVYFFAREGEFLKRSFDTFLKLQKISTLQTEYLYVSRQATLLPSLQDIVTEKFDILKKQINSISLGDFLKNLNLYEQVLEMDFWSGKYDLKRNELDFFNSNSFKDFIQEECFINLYNQARKVAKDEILHYLQVQGIDKKTSRIAVVDIGWKGSIQDNLSRILGERCVIDGFYYGLFGDVFLSENNRKNGLIFSEIPYRGQDYDIYKVSCRMIERILYASHGSCLRYDNGKPVLDSFSIAEGELYQFVEPVQERMIEMLVLIHQQVSDLILSEVELEKAISREHLKFILNITKQRMSQMRYMNERQKMNFGDWRTRENTISMIYRHIRNYKKMGEVERVNKLLIVLSKFHMWRCVWGIKEIYIRWKHK